MTVLAVLAVLENTLPCFCLSYKIQCQETTVTVFDGFGGFGGCGSFGRDGYPPLNPTPLFRHPEIFEQCQVVVFIADDLGFLGPGSPDLMTELCPPQDTA